MQKHTSDKEESKAAADEAARQNNKKKPSKEEIEEGEEKKSNKKSIVRQGVFEGSSSPILTSIMMEKESEIALEQAEEEKNNNLEKKSKVKKGHFKNEDIKISFLNPHVLPDLNLAYTSTQKNYTASSSMGYKKHLHLQQGRVFLGVLKNIDQLRTEQIPKILQSTNMAMEKICIEREEERVEKEKFAFKKKLQEEKKSGAIGQNKIVYAGAALIVCVIYRNEIFSSNVGTSRAILIRRYKNQEFRSHRLTVSHSLTYEGERKRVVNTGGVVEGDPPKLWGVLEMGRSFGDNHLGPGLICDPSIPAPKKTEKDEEAYIVIISEAITKIIDDDGIAEIFTEKTTNDERVSAILKESEEAGDEDEPVNKFAIIVPLDQPNLKEGEAVIAIGSDGHGGASVAELLTKEFGPKLQEEIKKVVSYRPFFKCYLEFETDIHNYISFFDDQIEWQKKHAGILKAIQAYVDLIIRELPNLDERPKYFCEVFNEIMNCKIEDIPKFITQINKEFNTKINIPDVSGYKKDAALSENLSFKDLVLKYSKPTSEEKDYLREAAVVDNRMNIFTNKFNYFVKYKYQKIVNNRFFYTQANARKHSIELLESQIKKLYELEEDVFEIQKQTIALVKGHIDATLEDHKKQRCISFFTTPDLVRAYRKTLSIFPEDLVRNTPAIKIDLDELTESQITLNVPSLGT